MSDSSLPPPRSSWKVPTNDATHQDGHHPTKSHSIPILNRIQRTESETNLCHDEAIAEYRDYCMYNRLVNGMIRQQEHALHKQCSRSLDSLYENGACIANIQRTRYGDTDRGRNISLKPTEKLTSTDDCTKAPKLSAEGADSFLAPTASQCEDEFEVFVLDF